MLLYTTLLLGTTLAAAVSLPVVEQLIPRAVSSSPTVTLKNGTYEGVHLPEFKQDLYLGMPFAQPPTGALRFSQPVSLNSTWQGVKNATSFGPGCLDSEDCLTINVVKPAGSSTKELPVLFWIFGGGFAGGSAADPAFNGSYIVQRSVQLGTPIIFVSINHRYGPLGLLASPEVKDSGLLNAGMLDQRLALHWVQENIASFGGSHKKVTLWGHSSGGYSVHAQAAAYGGRDDGLFRSLILDSSIMAFQNWTVESQTAGYETILANTNCTSAAAQLDCLRAVPIDTFRNASAGTGVYYPVPDGSFMQTSMMQAYRKGAFVKVPTIIGATSDDGTSGFLAPSGLNNDTAFEVAMLFALTPKNGTIQKYMEVYPNDPAAGAPYNTGEGVLPSGSQDKRSFAIFTDMVHAATRYATKRRSAFSSASKSKPASPVYSYRFAQIPQNGTMTSGVTHGSELPYIFGIRDHNATESPLGNRPEDEKLSRVMQDSWIRFVVSSDPNVTPLLASPKVKWEAYGKKGRNLVFKNSGLRMEKDDYREEGINLSIALALGELVSTLGI
ncbi:Alpha/Beta hydrolase protein [Leucosporidium creatinivorum]|uniref:Carboxylic ester hydrolase n=1 Tax=Leucosporidium creatinivorum TaxID=106004 RepID=A0A1Y2F7B0_9BASI|nr:Alpha/Beta hydrolase protein [Leucosporidium creatinivorum]